MNNYSFTNATPTALSHYHCPYLGNVFQWRNAYLTSAVFASAIATAVVNGLLSLITSSSNALVIFCILVNKRFRESTFILMLVSMSMTDFLVGSVVQPLYVVGRICEVIGRPDLVCMVRMVCQVSGVSLCLASLSHTSLISFERYLAVRFPTRYKTMMTTRRALVVISFIWLFSVTYAVLPVLGVRQISALVGRSVIIAIIVITTAACYTGTFLKLGASSAAVSSGPVSEATLQRIKTEEKKLARTMLYTVGILALCYCPEMIAYPIITKNPENFELIWITMNWTHTILFSNSLINPFWYCWRMPELRKAVLKLLSRVYNGLAEDNTRSENVNSTRTHSRRSLVIKSFSPKSASALDVSIEDTTPGDGASTCHDRHEIVSPITD